MGYPVPSDGEVLRSADLRALTWFGLERMGLGHRGRWGFFRPPRHDVANSFKVSGNEVRVRGLAMLSPQGIALVATNAAVPLAEGPFHASWRIPKDRNDTRTGEEATLHPGEAGSGEEAIVRVPIGRIEQNEGAWQVHLDAPVLCLNALEMLTDAWNDVCETVFELAERFVASQACQGLGGMLIAEASRELLEFDPGDDPRSGTRILNRVVFRMHEAVRIAEADESVLEQICEFLDAVKETDKCAAVGATALFNSLDAVSKKGGGVDRLRDWLCPRGTPLPCRKRLGRAGELEQRLFELKGQPRGAVAIRVEHQGPEPPVLWYALGKRKQRKASFVGAGNGFEATISEKERGSVCGLRVLCKRELGVVVCIL